MEWPSMRSSRPLDPPVVPVLPAMPRHPPLCRLPVPEILWPGSDTSRQCRSVGSDLGHIGWECHGVVRSHGSRATEIPNDNGVRSDMADQQPGIQLNVPQDVLDHFAKLGVTAETFSGGHLGEKLGIRIVEASPERVVGTMPV